MLIELFSLGVTAEALYERILVQKSAILFQRGPVDPKFSDRNGRLPPAILLLKIQAK